MQDIRQDYRICRIYRIIRQDYRICRIYRIIRQDDRICRILDRITGFAGFTG